MRIYFLGTIMITCCMMLDKKTSMQVQVNIEHSIQPFRMKYWLSCEWFYSTQIYFVLVANNANFILNHTVTHSHHDSFYLISGT